MKDQAPRNHSKNGMNNDHLRICANPRLVAHIAPFVASKSEPNPVLHGVHFARAEGRHGIYIVATNGKSIAIAYDAYGSVEGDRGDGATIKMAAPVAGVCHRSAVTKTVPLKFLVEGRRMSIAPGFCQHHSSLEAYVQPGNPIIFGAYPDWRKAVPDFAKLERGALRLDDIEATILSRVTGLGRGSKGNNKLTMWQKPGAGNPVIIQSSEVPEVIVIVMPVRTSGQDSWNRLAAFQ